MTDIRVARDVSMAFFFVGLVLFLTSFAGNYWIDRENYHNGIWKWCIADECKDLENPPDYLKATRGFMVMTLIILVVTFSLYCAWECKGPDDLRYGATSVGNAALAFVLITGAFNMIAIAVFAGEYTYEGFVDWSARDLGWAWYLGVVSAAIFFLDGFITLLAVGCGSSPPRPPAQPSSNIGGYATRSAGAMTHYMNQANIGNTSVTTIPVTAAGTTTLLTMPVPPGAQIHPVGTTMSPYYPTQMQVHQGSLAPSPYPQQPTPYPQQPSQMRYTPPPPYQVQGYVPPQTFSTEQTREQNPSAPMF